MEDMTRGNGVKTYGIQKATFDAYRGDVPKSVTWQKATQKQMNTVFDNTIKGFSSILDKATGNGFSARNEDEKAAIISAAWAFGTSAKTFGPVRDVLSKGGTTEELAIAISELKNPTGNSEYDNGYKARKFMCIPMMYGNYENVKDRKSWDEHRKSIIANANIENEVKDNCASVEKCKKMFNEQTQQINNASSILQNAEIQPKQEQPKQEEQKPKKEGFSIANWAKDFTTFVADQLNRAFLGNETADKLLQNSNKNAINKAGENNDGNTNNNMQQSA